MKKKSDVTSMCPELARSSQVRHGVYLYIHILRDVNLPYRSGRPAAPTSSSCWVVGVVGGRKCIYNTIIIYARPGHSPLARTCNFYYYTVFSLYSTRVPTRCMDPNNRKVAGARARDRILYECVCVLLCCFREEVCILSEYDIPTQVCRWIPRVGKNTHTQSVDPRGRWKRTPVREEACTNKSYTGGKSQPPRRRLHKYKHTNIYI